MNRRQTRIAAAASAAVGLAGIAAVGWADSPTCEGPYGLCLFSAGEKISSSAMNQNLESLGGHAERYERALVLRETDVMVSGLDLTVNKYPGGGLAGILIMSQDVTDSTLYFGGGGATTGVIGVGADRDPVGWTEGGGAAMSFQTSAYADTHGPRERMLITGAGDVGIGTGAPSAHVEIDGISGPADAALRLTQEDGGGYGMIIGNDAYSTEPTYGMAFWTEDDGAGFIQGGGGDPEERALVLNPEGAKVGIGTNEPSDTLDVHGGVAIGMNERLFIHGSSAAGAALLYSGEGTALSIGSDGTAGSIYVDQSGRVGVGFSTPQAPLHVRGTGATASYGSDNTASLIANFHASSANREGSLDIVGTNAVGLNSIGLVSYGGLDLATSGPDGLPYSRMMISGSGDVGIDTSSPEARLHVNGDALVEDDLRVDGSINEASDRRLKKEILPLQDALAGIDCLQGVTYLLRAPDASQDLQIGLIAQDVEQCYPEVVHTDALGMKSVSYARLVAPLIEAVKEQQEAIDAQEAREASLERRLVAQEEVLSRQAAALAALTARLEAVEGR